MEGVFGLMLWYRLTDKQDPADPFMVVEQLFKAQSKGPFPRLLSFCLSNALSSCLQTPPSIMEDEEWVDNRRKRGR